MKTVYTLLAFCFLIMVGCKSDTAVSDNAQKEEATKQVENARPLPNWARDANIYEVNIRQFTPEGTFNAFAKHLPRLRNMGVEILWLMPIFPISETKKKGTLGSYYAVSDFKANQP